MLEGEEHSLAVNMKTALTEHTAAKTLGDITPIAIGYKALIFNMLDDKKPIQNDAETKRDISNVRLLSADMDMTKDGNIANSKGDLSKVPKASREFLEPVSEQVLQALEVLAVPLPEGELKPLQTWKTVRSVLLGNSVVGVPAIAEIKYMYFGTRTLRGREVAVLDVQGTVKGVRGAGLNVGGKVNGLSSVALDTGEVLDATMRFKSDMDIEYKSKKGKVYGDLKIQVRLAIKAGSDQTTRKAVGSNPGNSLR